MAGVFNHRGLGLPPSLSAAAVNAVAVGGHHGGPGGGGGGGPAGGVGSRFGDLIEQLKQEHDVLHQELAAYRMEREQYEAKFQHQANELGLFQQALIELDRQHQKMRQSLEEENLRLRRDLTLAAAATGGQTMPMHTPILATAPLQTGAGFPLSANSTQLAPLDQQQQQQQQLQLQQQLALPHGFSNGAGPLISPIGIASLSGNVQSSPAAATANSAPAQSQSQSTTGSSKRHSRTDSSTPSQDGAGEYKEKEHKKRKSSSNSATSASAPSQPATGAAQSGSPSPVATTTDFDADTAPQSSKREGSDWMLILNQRVNPTTEINLAHNFDHNSVVCCVKFSADSKLLATGCNRSAHIFDVQSGALVCEFADNSNREGDLYIRSVCFSPDGTLLATGAEDRQIKLWDIRKGTIRSVLPGHEQDIYSLDFSKDGRLIASGSGDRSARIWDVESGKVIHILKIEDTPPQREGGITSIVFSPDGRYVAAGSLDRIVRVWDVKTGQLVEYFEGHRDSVYSVAFSPDGRLLVSGSLDHTLKLWDFGARRVTGNKTSPCKLTFSGHKGYVLSVGFTPDGKWIVSGSKDRSVQFWDPNTGNVQCVLQGHKNSVISVALSPDSNYFATGSGDLKARIWKYSS